MGNLKSKTIGRKQPRSPASNDVLASGENVRHSGLYNIEHDSDVIEQEIFIRKGTMLPFCQDCGNPIKYRLIQKMEYIAEDPDFS